MIHSDEMVDLACKQSFDLFAPLLVYTLCIPYVLYLYIPSLTQHPLLRFFLLYALYILIWALHHCTLNFNWKQKVPISFNLYRGQAISILRWYKSHLARYDPFSLNGAYPTGQYQNLDRRTPSRWVEHQTVSVFLSMIRFCDGLCWSMWHASTKIKEVSARIRSDRYPLSTCLQGSVIAYHEILLHHLVNKCSYQEKELCY